VIKIIPVEIAQKYQIVPLTGLGHPHHRHERPIHIFAIDDIKFMTGYNVEVVVSAETAIKTAIDKYYDHPLPLPMS